MSEQENPQSYVGDGAEQPEGTPYHEPQFEAPQYEAPQYEAPQYEAPQFEGPQYGTPQFDSPQFDSSQNQAPGLQPEAQPYQTPPPPQPYQPEAQPYQAPQPYQPGVQAFPPPPPQQQLREPVQEVMHGYQVQYPVGSLPVNQAPFGIDPVSGLPFSDKSKVIAGVLQIVLGSFGVGRFYMGNYGMAIAQILVTWLTLGIGAIWPFVDGIMILVGNPRDTQGRPLRS